jgi:hypothetical protein
VGQLKAISLQGQSSVCVFPMVKATSSMFLSFTGSVAYLQMADESNTRLMRDYVLETSHVDSEGK